MEVDADGTTWSLPLDVAPITGGSVLLGGRGPAGHLWTARLDGFPPVRVGDRITLGLDLTAAYLFDATTGQALQSQAKVAVFG